MLLRTKIRDFIFIFLHMYSKMVSVSLHTNYIFTSCQSMVSKEGAGTLPLYWKVTAHARRIWNSTQQRIQKLG